MKSKKTNNQLITHTLPLAILFIILVFSELIYAINNQPAYFNKLMVNYHLALSQRLIKTNHPSAAINHLLKTAEIKLHQEQNVFKLPLLKDINPAINYSIFSDTLNSIDYPSLSTAPAQNFAKPFYLLALDAATQSQNQLAEFFLSTSIKLAPQWSYFHVELANLYLLNNQTELATETINHCLNYHFPAAHCREFKDQFITTNRPQPPGFLKSFINLSPL